MGKVYFTNITKVILNDNLPLNLKKKMQFPAYVIIDQKASYLRRKLSHLKPVQNTVMTQGAHIKACIE